MRADRHPEAQAILERYARRVNDGRYSRFRPEVYLAQQERQRGILRMIRGKCGQEGVGALRLVEVGCGTGGNLLEFLQLGFEPENLAGIELIPERATTARHVLPADVILHEGDATQAAIPGQSVDIVFQSLVFSSLLDDEFQSGLARRMWSWIKPSGAVLWYDFTYDNPGNSEVRGVTLSRIRELFPDASISARRITLAPPISRRVCRIHESAYGIFNSFPFLRTHLLCWIGKRGN